MAGTYVNLPPTSLDADFTLADGVDFAVGTSTGTDFGTAITQKIGFYGVTPIVQRTNASQAAVVTTPAALISYGYTEAQANALVTLINELRAALVAVGIIKGS